MNASRASIRCLPRRSRRGLSLPEVLIAGSIVAMLLISIAMAFNALSQSVEINTRFNQAAQTARMGLRRLMTEVRTSETCAVGDDLTISGSMMSGDTITVLRPDGSEFSYAYNAADQTVRFKCDDEANLLDVVVARNVERVQFTSDVEPHPETGVLRTVRVVAELWINVDGQPLYLSGSAVPRREVVY